MDNTKVRRGVDMLFRVAICDDKEEDIKPVYSYLKAYEELHSEGLSFEIDRYTNPGKLLHCPLAQYDLYLLDILMGDLDGIAVAEHIRSRNTASGLLPCIVFLTSSQDFAIPAFSVHASGYLLKPVKQEDFFKLLDVILKQLEMHKQSSRQHFSFRTSRGFYNTVIDDILYVEIKGHTPFFHLRTEVVRGSDLRISFSRSMQPLLDTGLFLFPHSSYIVNARHVVSLTTRDLMLHNGCRIPVARGRMAQTKSLYMDFLMGESNHV